MQSATLGVVVDTNLVVSAAILKGQATEFQEVASRQQELDQLRAIQRPRVWRNGVIEPECDCLARATPDITPSGGTAPAGRLRRSSPSDHLLAIP